MRKHWLCLKYLLLHKWLVLREGRKLGVPLWRLVIHDLSKFSKAEWGSYAQWFHGWDGTGWRNAPKTVRLRTADVYILGGVHPNLERERHEAAFLQAWQHHYTHNSHHWNFWVSKSEADEDVATEMPALDRLEMLADWRAMGYGTKGYDDSKEFYLKTGEKMTLHPRTRAWVEARLGIIHA